MIRGLIFDFDGLILETEGPIYQSWVEIYHQFGQTLPLEQWVRLIGTWDTLFEPRLFLEQQLGRALDWERLEPQRAEREMELVLKQSILPGVADYLNSACKTGLRLGLASSSERAWVYGHLERLGLRSYFECIRVKEDVLHTKPAPDLYQAVMAALGLHQYEGVALEDSHHGIVSARAAGLYAVAVPHNLTADSDFTEAHLRLNSLADLPLPDLLARLQQ